LLQTLYSNSTYLISTSCQSVGLLFPEFKIPPAALEARGTYSTTEAGQAFLPRCHDCTDQVSGNLNKLRGFLRCQKNQPCSMRNMRNIEISEAHAIRRWLERLAMSSLILRGLSLHGSNGPSDTSFSLVSRFDPQCHFVMIWPINCRPD
jgi:hypothetical protein